MNPPPEGPGLCLVVGCGYVGARLARRLLPAVPVLAWVRRGSSAEALHRAGVPVRVSDLDGAEAFPDLPPPSTVVYLVPPPEAGTGDPRLARFLGRLGSARPGAFIYVSTTGVYGDTGGAVVDEDTPPVPREDRARRRLEAERQVGAWCGARGTRAVVFRVPAIYGPHRLPLERLQSGEPVLREEDAGPGNRIHVDDLVSALTAALSGEASGTFNIVDGDGRSLAAFQDTLADLAGLPRPRRVDWAEAQRCLSPGLLAFLRESRRVVSRRAGDLGWAPQYARAEDGLRASLAEMGWFRPSSAGR